MVEEQPKEAKKKKNLLIGCGVLVVIVIILAVSIGTCLGGTTTPTPAPPSPTEPFLLFDWTGVGGDFKDFSTHSEQWMLTWEFFPDPPSYGGISANYIGIYLDKTELLANIANVQTRKKQTYSLRGAGRHYIEVNSMGGTWRIYVYDYR